MSELTILPAGLAAGMLKTKNIPAGLIGIVHHIVFGSFKPYEWEGNKEPVYWYDPETGNSINAVGLKGQGLQAFLEIDLPEIIKQVAGTSTKIRVSLAPSNPDELKLMIDLINQSPYRRYIDEIEINFACPNHRSEDGRLHAVLAHDLVAVEEMMAASVELELAKSAKIAPNMNEDTLSQYPSLAKTFGFRAIVNGNTTPGSSFIKGEKRLSVDTGGQGGEILRAPCLKQTRILAPLCRQVGIDVYACGGIATGHTLQQHIDAGAVVGQVATGFMEFGPKVFQSMAHEFYS
jgi:dihydroorotate dehydrogenase